MYVSHLGHFGIRSAKNKYIAPMMQKITIYGSASSSHDVNRSHLVSGLRFGLYCGSIILNSHLIRVQKRREPKPVSPLTSYIPSLSPPGRRQ